MKILIFLIFLFSCSLFYGQEIKPGKIDHTDTAFIPTILTEEIGGSLTVSLNTLAGILTWDAEGSGLTTVTISVTNSKVLNSNSIIQLTIQGPTDYPVTFSVNNITAGNFEIVLTSAEWSLDGPSLSRLTMSGVYKIYFIVVNETI